MDEKLIQRNNTIQLKSVQTILVQKVAEEICERLDCYLRFNCKEHLTCKRLRSFCGEDY